MMSLERTAILVDGAFFIKRALKIFGPLAPEVLATRLFRYSCYHLKGQHSRYSDYLYRIFFYDCPPLNKKIHHPLTNQLIDFARSDHSNWRLELHAELRKRRKVALRLGEVDDSNFSWSITYDKVKRLCRKEITVDDLTEKDLVLNVKQKGVDMRIGLDISSLAFKKQVSKIVLIAGDSDFVPAAKQARREGIDFVLDPMWAPIKPDLYEHIDGLRSTFPRPPSMAARTAATTSSGESPLPPSPERE
jgi:uncharacterized LabA/DUF88 family protein